MYSSLFFRLLCVFCLCACSGGSDSTELADAGPIDDGGAPDGAPENDAAPAAQLETEAFFSVKLAMVPGSSVRFPMMLSELSTGIEFHVVRELRGFTEVQNQKEDVVLAVNDASLNGPEVGSALGSLPMANYGVFLENVGGATAVDNDYVAVKVIKRPSFPASVATFEQIVAASAASPEPFLDPNELRAFPFAAKAGFAYVIRGVRGKNIMYVIKADQLTLAENGEAFQAEYSWDGADGDLEPNAEALELTPGDYFVLIANVAPDANEHGTMFQLDEWRSL